MKEVYNPSMREEPYDHPTWIIPPRKEDTILRWLENAGRFIARKEDDEEQVGLSDHLVDEIIEADAYPEEEEEESDDED